MKNLLALGLVCAMLFGASSLMAGENKKTDDKIHIKNNTGAKIIGLWVSLTDNHSGEPDWEHNLFEGHPLTPDEVIDVAAFAGEHCMTYIFGVAENGDWWYVEQDTCEKPTVNLAEHKGEGKKKTK